MIEKAILEIISLKYKRGTNHLKASACNIGGAHYLKTSAYSTLLGCSPLEFKCWTPLIIQAFEFKWWTYISSWWFQVVGHYILIEYKPMQVVGPQTDPDSNLQNLVDFSIILLYKQKGGPPLGTTSLEYTVGGVKVKKGMLPNISRI